MKTLKDKVIITNNIYVYDKYRDSTEVIFDNSYNFMKVLELARDKIHEGNKLLSHPLSGSIKPNETPYKSILISKEKSDLDMSGLNIIEESIETSRKFLLNAKTPDWPENILEDFRTIDLSLVDNLINT